jgi:hypothetical protein
MDRLLRRHGLERRPSETPLQFSRRILGEETRGAWVRPAAEWYSRYGEARYGLPGLGRPVDFLKQEMESVKAALER